MTKEMKAYWMVNDQLVDINTMSTEELRVALKEVANLQGSIKAPEEEVVFTDLFTFEF